MTTSSESSPSTPLETRRPASSTEPHGSRSQRQTFAQIHQRIGKPMRRGGQIGYVHGGGFWQSSPQRLLVQGRPRVVLFQQAYHHQIRQHPHSRPPRRLRRRRRRIQRQSH